MEEGPWRSWWGRQRVGLGQRHGRRGLVVGDGRWGLNWGDVGDHRVSEVEVQLEAAEDHGVWQAVVWGVWGVAAAFLGELDE